MSSNLLKLCDPCKYYAQFLDQNIYPDGRKVSSFRPVTLQMGVSKFAGGSSIVQQGTGRVTCSVQPYLGAVSDSPVIIPFIKGSALISQELLDDAEIMIKQLIKQSAFLSSESLKTANGRLTWILHVHIMIFNADGAIFDALSTCVAGAFFDLRLPNVMVYCDEDMPVNINDALISDESFPIDRIDVPVSCTFIVYENKEKEEIILCDPISELFDLLRCSVTILVGNNGQIHRIIQRGVFKDETIKGMVEITIGRQKVVADSMIKAKQAHFSQKFS